MRDFHIKIVSPDGLKLDGNIKSLLIRTDDGDVEILASHTDYFATIGVGRARIIIDDSERFASVNGGFLSVSGGEVTLATTTFEFADEIDVERAKSAKEEAERRITTAKTQSEIDISKAKLMRAMNRLDVSSLM